MESQGGNGCLRCENANNRFNKESQNQLDLFLICPDGHALCKNCYQTYTNNQGQTQCPFDSGHQILRVDIPVKAFRIKEGSTVDKNVKEYLQLYQNNEKIKREIEQIKNRGPIIQHVPARKDENNIDQPVRANTLQQQLERLKKELSEWQQKTSFRHCVLFMILDTLLLLVQLAATIFQLYILFWSINTVIFYLSMIIVYYKVIFQLYEVTEVTLKTFISGLIQCLLAFVIFGYYFAFITDIVRKRYDRHSKRNQISVFKDPLAFEVANYSILIGKIAIFLQYFIRFYHFGSNILNQAILTFTILEFFALIGCDALYYHLKKQEEPQLRLQHQTKNP